MAVKVFLDTNVYETANFSFGNRHFSKLHELILNDEAILLYNDIVYKEVNQHIEDNLLPAVNQYNQVVRENRAFAPFREKSEWSSNIQELNATDMVSSLRNRWNSYLIDCCAEEIDISCVDVEDIVNKYFKKLLPFEGKKPYEFKDAIIIDSIRQYAKENPDDKIFVVSYDKGFRKSFKNDNDISVFSNLNKAINRVIQDEDNIAIELEALFNVESFINEVVSDVKDYASSGSVSVEDVFDEVDIISSECTDVQFEYVDSVESDSATVIATAFLTFTVEYSERDEDRSYYDHEERRYYWEVYNKYNCTFSTSKEFELYIAIRPEKEDPDSLFEYEYILMDDDFYLEQENMVDSEIIETISEDSEIEYDDSARYCPDCGCKLTFENDAGAFCIKCAPNH